MASIRHQAPSLPSGWQALPMGGPSAVGCGSGQCCQSFAGPQVEYCMRYSHLYIYIICKHIHVIFFHPFLYCISLYILFSLFLFPCFCFLLSFLPFCFCFCFCFFFSLSLSLFLPPAVFQFPCSNIHHFQLCTFHKVPQ